MQLIVVAFVEMCKRWENTATRPKAIARVLNIIVSLWPDWLVHKT